MDDVVTPGLAELQALLDQGFAVDEITSPDDEVIIELTRAGTRRTVRIGTREAQCLLGADKLDPIPA